jgi:peroxiredoxin
MRAASDILKPGDLAPEFSLESATGERFDSTALRGAPAAIFFFRGTW